jgi:undecaprenyl diphosphate synthase
VSLDSEKLPTRLPRHVAIIMDGNGRWAIRHGKPRFAGHRAGVKVARAVVESCARAGIEVLTLFAFSSENWNRPADEVNALMRLFVEVLQREAAALHDNGIRLRFIGERRNLPTILQKRMADAETMTQGNQRMTLILAVGFGGRWDLVQAMQRIASKVRSGDLDVADIDQSVVARHMSMAGISDPDLLIRTGGECRVSNFLLWDFAYTELFFTDTLWPDFDDSNLLESFEFYGHRKRRFGRVDEPIEASGD